MTTTTPTGWTSAAAALRTRPMPHSRCAGRAVQSTGTLGACLPAIKLWHYSHGCSCLCWEELGRGESRRVGFAPSLTGKCRAETQQHAVADMAHGSRDTAHELLRGFVFI